MIAYQILCSMRKLVSLTSWQEEFFINLMIREQFVRRAFLSQNFFRYFTPMSPTLPIPIDKLSLVVNLKFSCLNPVVWAKIKY